MTKPKKGNTKSNRLQGHSAGTILTNGSQNITVIDPYENRRSDTAPSLRRGTRWMHRTTLTLDEKKWKTDYQSSAKSVRTL